MCPQCWVNVREIGPVLTQRSANGSSLLNTLFQRSDHSETSSEEVNP